MPYYDRIDVFEGIDVNKTSQCKEYDICHCLEFLHKRFKFQPCTCSGYHDVLMTSMNLSNIVILNIHGADYCCIISGISKSEAIRLLQKADLNEKCRALLIIKIIYKVYKKWIKKYKVWWYWNWKTQISPTQKPYYDQNFRYL